MANKTDVLNELTVPELKELAEANDAKDELTGLSSKPEIVDALKSSSKVTKRVAQEKLDARESSDEEDNGDDGDAEPEVDEAMLATSGKLPTNAGNTGRAAPTVDEAAEASPSGVGNTTGTPMSQLNQTQMVDPSGSNIPAANLRQPAAEGQIEAVAPQGTSSTSLDNALTDPEAAAQIRVEGRTSDAANRVKGVTASDVPPDLNDGPKQSDAGPELYPFPPGGDVDVATVPDGANPGEYLPNLEVGDSVILDGSHDLVPDRLDGRRALVVDAPRYLVPLDRADDVYITVQTRDEVNARLSIPLAATKSTNRGVEVTVRG